MASSQAASQLRASMRDQQQWSMPGPMTREDTSSQGGVGTRRRYSLAEGAIRIDRDQVYFLDGCRPHEHPRTKRAGWTD